MINPETEDKRRGIGNTTINKYWECFKVLGILINEQEIKEIQYMIKRELDEILFDIKDERIDPMIKTAMEERYKTLFALFRRVAPSKECFQYMRSAKKNKLKKKR